jgi:DNA gyrase inhibitor GyrI/DNA-binding transcriptional ArsR family regulator
MYMIMDDASDSYTRRLFARYSRPLLQLLQTLSQEHRFTVLKALLDHSSTFQELQYLTDLGKTALSHHLKVLVEHRLIEKVKRGVYIINSNELQILNALAGGYYASNLRKLHDMVTHSHYIQQNLSYTQKETIKQQMQNISVKIQSLPPMRVASVRAIGTEPESLAWAKMKAYIANHGWLQELDQHPIFGFNNPEPEPGQLEYGYEFWVKVDSSVTPTADLQVKEFPGGLYAVTPCNVSQESQDAFFKEHGMLKSWYFLNQWVEQSDYVPGNHQWLEQQLNLPEPGKDTLLDLYYPIMRP